MRKSLPTAALAIALAALTFAPAAGFAANPPQTATTPPQQGAAPPTAAGGHPVMHKAINQLERVKEELQNDASRDFDGRPRPCGTAHRSGHPATATGHSVRQALRIQASSLPSSGRAGGG